MPSLTTPNDVYDLLTDLVNEVVVAEERLEASQDLLGLPIVPTINLLHVALNALCAATHYWEEEHGHA